MNDVCIALFLQEQKQKATTLYYAECLRLISENTAKQCGGRYMQVKFADIIDPKPKDERTKDDIISGIKEKIENINK